MMAVALLGSLLNLYLVWHIRRCAIAPRRNGGWRRLGAKKLASERLQISFDFDTATAGGGVDYSSIAASSTELDRRSRPVKVEPRQNSFPGARSRFLSAAV